MDNYTGSEMMTYVIQYRKRNDDVTFSVSRANTKKKTNLYTNYTTESVVFAFHLKGIPIHTEYLSSIEIVLPIHES